MATHLQVHSAGRHLAVAEALLRGYDASLRGPRTYIEVNGHVAQVQVATQGAWMVENIDKYLAGTVDTVVLVDTTGGVREFYIAPGDQLRRLVEGGYARWLASVGGTRPRNPASKHTAISPEAVRRWRGRWKRFER